MSLTFDPAAHRYRLDGKPVTGVTSLISGGTPKEALIWWAATTAGEWAAEHKDELATMADESIIRGAQREHMRRRDDAGVTGTAVHALAEQLHEHGTVETSDPLLASFVEGYAEFLDAWEITPVLFERPCANRAHWYAGMFDLLCTSPHLAGGELVQIDLKTSKSVHGETALQTAAYSRAEFYVDGFDTETPMPEIAATYVAHVTPTHRDGSAARYGAAPLGTSLYTLAQTPRQLEEHFQMFLHAAATAKTKTKRDRLIKDPLTTPETTTTDAATTAAA
ncbi:hypothetical protein [Nesterenkonia sp. HG001]|uniref:hypothetical protein n=1 Tax=Nesterenkonia sp. HG001 TaxID=2983207 RepID=UPI002AC65163|nr:hypothetical protein [Nesterenkonia sp. HG001]MDZ5076779.1 hypothetical protein [Nesterenkonia sp. HG001]